MPSVARTGRYKARDPEPTLRIPVAHQLRFTYSASFSALVATSAAEFSFWRSFSNKGIEGGILYLCIPLVLVFVNALAIEVGATSPIVLSRS